MGLSFRVEWPKLFTVNRQIRKLARLSTPEQSDLFFSRKFKFY